MAQFFLEFFFYFLSLPIIDIRGCNYEFRVTNKQSVQGFELMEEMLIAIVISYILSFMFSQAVLSIRSVIDCEILAHVQLNCCTACCNQLISSQK